MAFSFHAACIFFGSSWCSCFAASTLLTWSSHVPFLPCASLLSETDHPTSIPLYQHASEPSCNFNPISSPSLSTFTLFIFAVRPTRLLQKPCFRTSHCLRTEFLIESYSMPPNLILLQFSCKCHLAFFDDNKFYLNPFFPPPTTYDSADLPRFPDSPRFEASNLEPISFPSNTPLPLPYKTKSRRKKTAASLDIQP